MFVAVLENIVYQRMTHDPHSPDAEFGFVPNQNRKPVESFPQICFSDGEPWREAN